MLIYKIKFHRQKNLPKDKNEDHNLYEQNWWKEAIATWSEEEGEKKKKGTQMWDNNIKEWVNNAL